MGHSLPVSDLINCGASYSTGIHPNAFPWPTRSSDRISVPLAFPSRLQPPRSSWRQPNTVSVLSHLRVPALAFLPIRTTLPHIFLWLPLLKCHLLREALAKHPNRSAPTPMPILTPPALFLFFRLLITITIISFVAYMLSVYPTSQTPLEGSLPEGRDCDLFTPRFQHPELCPPLNRGSVNICCLNCYCF